MCGLYSNPRPVKRANLINKTLPLIKSVALEYYNKTASTMEITDKLKQIGRNHIISWPIPPSVEYPVAPYLCRIETQPFIEKFRRFNVRLDNNYGLALSNYNEYCALSETRQINKYSRYNGYPADVEILINKALKISNLPLIAGKALRKFHKFLSPLKRILYY